jgi:ankyrin repeat protein
MSNILHLISENSYEAVHAILEECRTSFEKSELSNQKDERNTSPLFLAAKARPPNEAVRLINALVASGAYLDNRDNEGRNVLLNACAAGVDPMIFDALLNFHPNRQENYV